MNNNYLWIIFQLNQHEKHSTTTTFDPQQSYIVKHIYEYIKKYMQNLIVWEALHYFFIRKTNKSHQYSHCNHDLTPKQSFSHVQRPIAFEIYRDKIKYNPYH